MSTDAQDAVFTIDRSSEPRSKEPISPYLFIFNHHMLLDLGTPLGPEDFFRASQLPMIPTNMTSERMMKVTWLFIKTLVILIH